MTIEAVSPVKIKREINKHRSSRSLALRPNLIQQPTNCPLTGNVKANNIFGNS